MKIPHKEPDVATDGKPTSPFTSPETLSRRRVLVGSAAAGATAILGGEAAAAAEGKRTFTILHTNDLHSNLIGMAPASDYSPTTLNDDATRGGFERLATLIARRKAARQDQGPVLVLDAGDYSMGTAFAAATRETGCELQLLFPDGVSTPPPSATMISTLGLTARPSPLRWPPGLAGFRPWSRRIPTSRANDATLAGLQRLARDGVLRRYLVIERGGIRFGIFGVLGKEAQFYTGGAGAVTFTDPIETAREMVKLLRETEKADVIIALSHGGLEKGKDGRFTTARTCAWPRPCRASTWSSARTATPRCTRRSSSTAARPWSRPGSMAKTSANW